MAMIGETLGSYRLTRKLGEGAIGEVYLGRHLHMSRQAAVKVLRPEVSGSADHVSRFFAEARAADLVDHKGIVKVFDCAVHGDGRAYLVMEYLEGETLAAALDRMDIVGGSSAFYDVAIQIADALQAAHTKGVVHRDLKPDNVFLTYPAGDARSLLVKILDFGIAKLTVEGGTRATKTGSVLGTPLYMSPEQSRGSGTVDHRADIYSLGCMMFEMVCGRPPFVRDGIGDLIVAHIAEMPPLASTIQPAIPPELDDLIKRMLAKSADDRPQGMADVVNVLQRFRARESTAAATHSLPNPPTQAPASGVERALSQIAPAPRSPLSEVRHWSANADVLVVNEVARQAPIWHAEASPVEARAPILQAPRLPVRREALSTMSSSASTLMSDGATRSAPGKRRGVFLAIGGICATAALAGAVVVAVRPPDQTAVPPVVASSLDQPSRGVVTTLAPVELPLPPPPPSAAAPPPAELAPPRPPAVRSADDVHANIAEQPRPHSIVKAAPRRKAAASTNNGAKASGASLAAARDAFASGDFVAASIQAKRAAREGVGAAAFLLLGDSLMRLDKAGEATRAYEGAIELEPANAAAKRALRRAQLKAK